MHELKEGLLLPDKRKTGETGLEGVRGHDGSNYCQSIRCIPRGKSGSFRSTGRLGGEIRRISLIRAYIKSLN